MVCVSLIFYWCLKLGEVDLENKFINKFIVINYGKSYEGKY